MQFGDAEWQTVNFKLGMLTCKGKRKHGMQMTLGEAPVAERTCFWNNTGRILAGIRARVKGKSSDMTDAESLDLSRNTSGACTKA